jgi:type I restriction enzyme S subunit
MNQIEQLLFQFCPNGVPVERIDNLINYEQPTKYLVASKTYDDRFATPVLTAGQTFLLGYTSEEHGKYPASPLSPVIIFDDFTTAYKWVDFEFKVKSSAMKMLTVKPGAPVSLRYFWYALSTIRIDTSEHTRYWISKFSSIGIPLPPIEVQQEIVRILDQFIELDAELEAELHARKSQYAYLRESLFEKDSSFLSPLYSVASIWRGRRFVKDDILPEGVPAIHYGEIYTKFGLAATEAYSYLNPALAAKLRFASPGDVILVSAGETIEDIGKSFTWLGKQDVVIHDACYGLRSETVDPRYMVHFFNTHNFRLQLRKYISSSKISAVSTEKLGKVFIPVPSLDRQREVADVLDSFDRLISDKCFGIPAEINARRQQYEYYRSKILTFKKLETA